MTVFHDDDVAAKGDDIRDQWEPCGLGICAATAGHEGTCAEASGWADGWTPKPEDLA